MISFSIILSPLHFLVTLAQQGSFQAGFPSSRAPGGGGNAGGPADSLPWRTHSTDISGAPAEDGEAAAATEAAAEAGEVLTVQRRGAHAAHVGLCAPCPLDGLRLVCHRAPGDGGQ